MQRLVLFLSLLAFLAAARGELTRIEVGSTVPFAAGKAFGPTGPYVRVMGRFYGELDPSHPANRGIVDLRLAPRNAQGRVEYSADFELLRPADPMKGNGTLLYDVNNRGNKRVIHLLNDVAPSNALDSPESAGDGFLMRQGFSIAWSGWIPGAGRAAPRARYALELEVPAARGVQAPVWDEFLYNSEGQTQALLSFAAVPDAKMKPQLSVREKNDEAPTVIAPNAWELVEGRMLRLLPQGRAFRAGALYQFSYVAKDPPIAGIGYAATRDFIAFLRYQARDKLGNPNPLGPEGRHKVAYTLAHGTSQSGRFLRDMIHQGFNETEDLRQVFDGINPHIASARLFLNFRFAQPNRAYSLGYGFLGYPDATFPFAYEKMRDDLSRREDGLLERCRTRTNCPKIMQTVTSTEYWQGGHSLGTTDATGGRDLVLPENVRIYHFAGTQHVISQIMPKGVCAAPANTVIDPRPVMRALILALDRWVKEDVPPPPSVYPRLSDKTLVAADSLRWPKLPGFAAPRGPNPMLQFDYGAKYDEGILENAPPKALEYRYKVYVPAIDADGNELAGLRVPEQAVPAATTTGWALRSVAGGAAGELCYLDGSLFPFARTADERAEKKDPRPSMVERYGTKENFLARLRAAAAELQRKGYLRAEDVETTIARAEKRPW
ncbi:MAG TPA: alpha/beta hydrolase domain-containing protein [Burkholderiales bacterium]|jgi:hypothetical protein|nr:alpha/beta hydrolase domain-containing protein [Burkholderiales bacterium]